MTLVSRCLLALGFLLSSACAQSPRLLRHLLNDSNRSTKRRGRKTISWALPTTMSTTVTPTREWWRCVPNA